MVEPLRDPAFFRRVFLEFGALAWPNGFDLDSDRALRPHGEGRRTHARGGGVTGASMALNACLNARWRNAR